MKFTMRATGVILQLAGLITAGAVIVHVYGGKCEGQHAVGVGVAFVAAALAFFLGQGAIDAAS